MSSVTFLDHSYFDRDAIELAQSLLGKIIRVKYNNLWLSAKIIETEAYYLAWFKSRGF